MRQAAVYAAGGAIAAMVFCALSAIGELKDSDIAFGFWDYAIPAGWSIALAVIALLVTHFGRSWPAWLLTSISVVIIILVMLGVLFTIALFAFDQVGF